MTNPDKKIISPLSHLDGTSRIHGSSLHAFKTPKAKERIKNRYEQDEPNPKRKEVEEMLQEGLETHEVGHQFTDDYKCEALHAVPKQCSCGWAEYEEYIKISAISLLSQTAEEAELKGRMKALSETEKKMKEVNQNALEQIKEAEQRGYERATKRYFEEEYGKEDLLMEIRNKGAIEVLEELLELREGNFVGISFIDRKLTDIYSSGFIY